MILSRVGCALTVVEQATAEFQGRLCYPTALSLECAVILDLLARLGVQVPVVTVDTGMLPEESHAFMRALEDFFGIRITVLRPDPREVEAMVAERGRDLFRLSVALRRLCCEVRKVRPLARYLKGKAWITGRRRDQSAERRDLPPVERTPSMGLVKFNPLVDWSWDDVWRYVREHGLPYHPLYDRHYRSIGCAPCTRAIAAGEDERAGRWWWELGEAAPECGLHMNPLDRRREQGKVEIDERKKVWQGKRVLITGVCGTIGRELLRQVVELGAYEIVGMDNNESELFFLAEEYRRFRHVHLYLGDVRDKNRLVQLMEGMDIVLHAAALKHVILCEKSPTDAVQTNILGTQHVIEAALAHRVERVLFTSSDKAVNPTNVMGTSKLMGERLMTAANALRRGERPVFASTRFGNVLGSRGSVIPLFKKQIEAGGPVTLTDPAMTRFIMTIEEATRLVLDSVFLAKGGEVFVTKMPAVRIEDLARAMIAEIAGEDAEIPMEVIGAKPGEKLYEELLNEEETRRTVELERYFVILPAFKSVYEPIVYEYPGMGKVGIARAYRSSEEPCMGVEEIRRYLRRHQLV